MPPEEVSVNTLFLGISSSDLGGAPGLLDAFVPCVSGVKVETTKLVGVTTDGENAKTEEDSRLWKLLKEHTRRDILTTWCVCHCSDLAVKSVQAQVPELSIGCLMFLQCQHFSEYHHGKRSCYTRYD